VAELNVWGFNLLRSSDGRLADAVQVNQNAILATGNSGNGASYEFVDTSASAGGNYAYWLQVVNTDGSTQNIGPVTVTRPARYRLFAPLINAGSRP